MQFAEDSITLIGGVRQAQCGLQASRRPPPRRDRVRNWSRRRWLSRRNVWFENPIACERRDQAPPSSDTFQRHEAASLAAPSWSTIRESRNDSCRNDDCRSLRGSPRYTAEESVPATGGARLPAAVLRGKGYRTTAFRRHPSNEAMSRGCISETTPKLNGSVPIKTDGILVASDMSIFHDARRAMGKVSAECPDAAIPYIVVSCPSRSLATPMRGGFPGGRACGHSG